MQFLTQKLKLPPNNVEALLNYGIPCEDPEYVMNVVHREFVNPLLMKNHTERAQVSE